MRAPSPLARLAENLDRRIGRRADPPSLWPTGWASLLSHAAIVAFILLTVTGLALAIAYRPSTAPITYEGASELYDGEELPHAFASVIRISEDLPGGALLRRVHVASSHLLLIALVAHLLRVLATGAFRHPRLRNHLIGVGLLLVSLGFAYTGELMPFTLVASSSLRIAAAILGSLPVVGEPLGQLVIGSELPSDRILIAAWALHVVLLPAAFVGLLGLHLHLVRRHTPGSGRRPDIDVTTITPGRPLWPDAVARFSLLTTLLTALILASAVVVPWSDVELEGPFYAAEATNSVHPTWPLFFTTGSLRILPAIDLTFAGVRITSVLVAGALVPGILVAMVAAYPFMERRITGDRDANYTLDHPLDVPFRAGTVAGLTSVAVVLSLGAGVDVLSYWLHVPVERIVLAFRIALVTVPALSAGAAVRTARRRSVAATPPSAPSPVVGR